MSEDAGFRRYLFPADDARIAGLKGLDAYAYREAAKEDDFTGALIRGWRPLYPAEFHGITSDGSIIENLYELQTLPADEAAPTAAMVAAAEVALAALTAETRAMFCYAIDAVEWQSWANPEFMQHDTGLRLEALEPGTREALLGLLDASLSPEGSALARTLMQINAALGEITGLEGIMNEFSYNMALYGTPSLTAPWGWQLFGHHVAINCVVVGTQMVVTPIFFGAEPDRLDDADAAPFAARIAHARDLLGALTPEQRANAVVFEKMVDPSMPEGRIHPGDERHLAGAFQDNRVIPYEGVRLSELTADALEHARSFIREFIAYLPSGAARARMSEIEAHFDDTWFSWIGSDDVFYARLQSPVVILEIDHHCGVFLSNREPAAFHIHTIIRTPNGNDYARALVRQHGATHG